MTDTRVFIEPTLAITEILAVTEVSKRNSLQKALLYNGKGRSGFCCKWPHQRSRLRHGIYSIDNAGVTVIHEC